MQKLNHDDLFKLEDYAKERQAFRARIMAHKKNRKVHLGAHATLYFEDRLTVQYQVQEMLRTERIFEAAAIQEELDAYNPLIPDGSNWKAVFMIEYEDIDERRVALEKLIDIEDKVWVQIDGFDKVYAIADEDLDRETADKTSAVHFVRFELGKHGAAAVKSGASVGMGIDHPEYPHAVDDLPDAVRDALGADLDA